MMRPSMLAGAADIVIAGGDLVVTVFSGFSFECDRGQILFARVISFKSLLKV